MCTKNIITLDPNRAVGLDEIGPRVLIFHASVLTKLLHHLLSIPMQYAVILHQWKIHKVISVFKSGDRISVKYCPISLY